VSLISLAIEGFRVASKVIEEYKKEQQNGKIKAKL
jgi:hypothetical protein